MNETISTIEFNALTDKAWTIGQEWDGNTATDHFNGFIDDIRIYNRAVGQSEIGLLSLWRLVCEGNFNEDESQDDTDLEAFAAAFGKAYLESSLDDDTDMDGKDLAMFISDYGRTDCPVCTTHDEMLEGLCIVTDVGTREDAAGNSIPEGANPLGGMIGTINNYGFIQVIQNSGQSPLSDFKIEFGFFSTSYLFF